VLRGQPNYRFTQEIRKIGSRTTVQIFSGYGDKRKCARVVSPIRCSGPLKEESTILKPFLREGVMPLPVTFISTLSTDGIRNIAPWSCIMPILRPLDLICAASAHKRDTLKNVRDTGEFVVNLSGVQLVDKVIPTARPLPPEVDEFVVAGIDEKPSVLIKAPGMAGCYAWMECKLHRLFEEENYALIVGQVVRLEISDEVLASGGKLDLTKAKPLMMTGLGNGMNFCTLQDMKHFEAFSAVFENGKDPLAEKYKS
jgi:flavin reductase (DIM6/NTAB) family NADH-FMN oxidoreductase RutF